MKLVVYTLALLSTLPLVVHAEENPKSSKEYDIKAAFIYKFMVFTDWSQEKLPDSNEPFVMAIIGQDPFGNAFEPLKNEQVKGRKVVIKRLPSMSKPDESGKNPEDEVTRALVRAQVIFICASEAKDTRRILETVAGHSVLTVADVPGFAESGGMIGLSVEDAKVRFEVNSQAASKAGLKISSQLLRLAKKVIRDDASQSESK